MNRRELVQRVVAGGVILVLSPSLLESCTKQSTDPASDQPGGDGTGNKIILDLTTAANAALSPDGGWLVVQNVIVINTGGGKYSALSAICTHQGCTVGFNSSAGKVQCPCHGSVYSTSGSVLNGPATVALQSYAVSLEGDILTITK
jgi:cytochrome b6-f complex iron-sulfur subunit